MSSLPQQLEYSEKPIPHLIIDNFLPSHTAKEMILEAVKLKDKFTPADIGTDSQYVDDCEACKKIREINKMVKRKNDVLYLSHDDKEPLIFETAIQKVISDASFQDLVSNLPSMFPIMNNCDSSEAILSRHGMCDFYGWHTDNGGSDLLMKRRIITIIYYFNIEPQKFTGGELILSYPDIRTVKTIQPKHNRAIIFPSQHTHCVNTVTLESEDFKDGRFAINYWVGFK